MNSKQLGISSDMSLLPSGNPKIRKTFKKSGCCKIKHPTTISLAEKRKQIYYMIDLIFD